MKKIFVILAAAALAFSANAQEPVKDLLIGPGNGNWFIFFQRPICIVFMVLLVLLIVMLQKGNKKEKEEEKKARALAGKK